MNQIDNSTNFFKKFNNQPDWHNSAWLILGKGPTFSKINNFDIRKYKILTLNDAIREVSDVEIAHFVDFDAFERCAEITERHARIVVLPWFPHFHNKASAINLSTLIKTNQSLARLASEGRLCWYDLNSASVQHGNYPVVSALYFSAEAAFDLLATAGTKHIRSLGLDGGQSYGTEFQDLSDISHLSNRQKNFDRQFESFAKVIVRTGVDYSPLDLECPIRVYVATTVSERLAFKVLEYSIKQHCSVSVEVMALCDTDIPITLPIAPENQPRTPFSFQRFLIPQINRYTGRAIYLDADMLVFKDILHLWRRPFDEAEVLAAYSDTASGRKPQFSVMLLDCNKLKWQIDEIVSQLNSGKLTYEQLMYDFTLAKTRATIESDWNALESYKPDKTSLLHYTDMNTQPWISHLNPLGYLWVATLRKAIEEGEIPRSFVEAEIIKGHIRPSLLYQLDHNIDDSILLPAPALALDAKFAPPYRNIPIHTASPWRNHLLRLRSVLRSNYHRTKLYKLERRVRSWLYRQLD